MSAESEVKVAKNRSQIYLAELTTEGSKRRPKIQPKGFVARKPARTKAQSPSVRTFLGLAIAPLFISFLIALNYFGSPSALEHFGKKWMFWGMLRGLAVSDTVWAIRHLAVSELYRVRMPKNMNPKMFCSLEFSLVTFFVSRQRK